MRTCGYCHNSIIAFPVNIIGEPANLEQVAYHMYCTKLKRKEREPHPTTPTINKMDTATGLLAQAADAISALELDNILENTISYVDGYKKRAQLRSALVAALKVRDEIMAFVQREK